jgi:hypothetical protein
MECTNKKLKEFSFEHYTYINQIFGDQSVREIITEVFPNKQYQMSVEPGVGEFVDSHHHTLTDKKSKDIICSVENDDQDLAKNKNDTLCQSYSLLTYLKIPIKKDQKKKQIDMIAMYRNILSNKKFVGTIIKEILNNPANKRIWKNETLTNKPYLIMDSNLIKIIKDVLDKWENYGYLYFIGDGTCPKNPTNGDSSKRKRAITKK